MLSWQVLPGFTRQDCAYSGAGQRDASGDLTDGNTLRAPSSNHPYFYFGHLRGWAVLPEKGRAVRHLIGAVLGLCGPTQVGCNVVVTGAVVVGNPVRWGRPRSVKRCADKAVDGESCFGAANRIAKRDIDVPISAVYWPENLPGGAYEDEIRGVSLSSVSGSASPNAPKATDFVVRPVFDHAPFFEYSVVSHCASLQAWWSEIARSAATSARSRYFTAGRGLNKERTFE